MTIYVYEELSASPSANPFCAMAREGEAMLRSVTRDLSAIDRVIPILHASRDPHQLAGEPIIVNGRSFEELLDDADPHAGWLVIAPETGGSLRAKTQAVERRGYRLLSPGSAWVALGENKNTLPLWAQSLAFPTFETQDEAWQSMGLGDNNPSRDATPASLRQTNSNKSAAMDLSRDLCRGIVAKRPDGAGAENVFGCPFSEEERIDWPLMLKRLGGDWVYQPWLDGVQVRWQSRAFIGQSDGTVFPLPIADQFVEAIPMEGTPFFRFRYLGGRVPSNHVADSMNGFQQRLLDKLQSRGSVDSRRGYFGVDMVQAGEMTWLIELNPRLTTSYVGYSHWIARASGRADTMGRLLLGQTPAPLDLETPAVLFRSDGVILDENELGIGQS